MSAGLPILPILPSPDDVTSFLLRLVFGQSVIVTLILSLKALYAWYSLAKGAVSAGQDFMRAISRRRIRTVRLYGLVIPVIVLSSIGTIIWIWAIAALIHKQSAAGGVYSSAPYGLFALLLGIAGTCILWVVAVFAVSEPESGTNYVSVALYGIPVIAILGIIVAVVISNLASRPSSPEGMSGQPSAASSQDTTTLKLKCDPDIGGSDCGRSIGTTPSDGVALDIVGRNVYSLCNRGYSLHFVDNHGEHLDTISGNACLNSRGVDSSTLSGGGGPGAPYVTFNSPEHADTGNPRCGPWVITLRVKKPAGAVLLTARYRTTVRC